MIIVLWKSIHAGCLFTQIRCYKLQGTLCKLRYCLKQTWLTDPMPQNAYDGDDVLVGYGLQDAWRSKEAAHTGGHGGQVETRQPQHTCH